MRTIAAAAAVVLLFVGAQRGGGETRILNIPPPSCLVPVPYHCDPAPR